MENLLRGENMRTMLGSFVAMLLLLSLAAADNVTDNVTIETNKTIYDIGEVVQFTMYNSGIDPIEIDFKPSVLDNNTGKCILGCVWAAFYNPITVSNSQNYSWTWDQKGENGQVDAGTYKAMLGGYYSNEFKIVYPDTILTYYRGLGQNASIIETRDLMKAFYDWKSGTIPPGFSVSITIDQLLTLVHEWEKYH
jgi:hypothetical protein